MAVEARPELVGKRFLCVSGDEPPEIGDIGRWPWRSGVIRAVSHRDNDNPDLTVRVNTIYSPLISVTCKIRWKTAVDASWSGLERQQSNVGGLPYGNLTGMFVTIAYCSN